VVVVVTAVAELPSAVSCSVATRECRLGEKEEWAAAAEEEEEAEEEAMA
jgi:hypothetical protein